MATMDFSDTQRSTSIHKIGGKRRKPLFLSWWRAHVSTVLSSCTAESANHATDNRR